MDKTLTTQFILWLDSQGIQLRGEDTALIDTDRELPGLMDRFVDEWFTPAKMRERNPGRTEAFMDRKSS